MTYASKYYMNPCFVHDRFFIQPSVGEYRLLLILAPYRRECLMDMTRSSLGGATLPPPVPPLLPPPGPYRTLDTG